MALKMIQRFPLLVQFGIQRCPVGPACPARFLGTTNAGQSLCVACLCTSADRCILRQGCLKLRSNCGIRSITTIVREPLFVASSSVELPRSSVHRLHLTQLCRPTSEEEESFQQRLLVCYSSQKVFNLLQSVAILSDTMAAAALHRVADLEQEGRALKDPTVLENDTIRALCLQLEQESGQLTDAGLVSALLACTRLYLDPWSTLMVRLVTESYARLDRGQMSVEQLCTFAQAMLSIEGPGFVMLEQVMEQIQRKATARWSLRELVSVYRLLEGTVYQSRKYKNLLNEMNAHALTLTSLMDCPAVTLVLSTLMKLNQVGAKLLVVSLCKQVTQLLPHFFDEELTLILGALIFFRHSDQGFVKAMERYVPTMAFTTSPETVAKVMHFFGRRNILSPAVFDAIAESFVSRADSYSASQVARQIMSFGKLGYLPPNADQVLRKVEAILDARLSQFQPRTLLNLLHACDQVGMLPVKFVPNVFSSHFLEQLQEQGIDRSVLSRLTQLYMTVKLEHLFYKGPSLPSKYQVKSFITSRRSLETPVDPNLYDAVTAGLVNLLGDRSYFESSVLTPYCYTLDVEIKLDKGGYVLPTRDDTRVHKRVALCIDGQSRFTVNVRQLLGKEAIKQRHLRLLGYEVVQIPFYEFEELKTQSSVVEYLHKKIFSHLQTELVK